MKKLYTLSFLALFGQLCTPHLAAQCTPSNPTEVPPASITSYNGVSSVTFLGAAGHDYFTFLADTAKTYIFSTHYALGGYSNIPNNDLQITLQDSLGNPIGGEFGQSFQDDYNLSGGVYDPFMVWSPNYKGKYRMVLTKYQSGGCIELAAGDTARVYAGSYKLGNKFAIFHEIQDTSWHVNENWVYYSGIGTPQMGKPTNMKAHFVLMNGLRPGKTTVTIPDSCKTLCITDYFGDLNIPANKSLEIFDTLMTDAMVMGDGDLVIHKNLNLTNYISVKELVLKGDPTGSKIHISESAGMPYRMDTLTIDNVNGVQIDGIIHPEWVKFKQGKVTMGQSSIPLYVYNFYILSGHSGASAQSYIDNSIIPGSGGLFASRINFLVGSGGYVIPLGNATRYRPIKIDLQWGDSVGVEVFYANTSYTRMHHDPSLSEVSSLEFWDIQLDYTYTPTFWNTPPAIISLNWDGQSGVNSTELTDLRVACNDTNYTQWLNRGQTAISSSGNTGWISSIPSAIQKTYTLAAANGSHALPLADIPLMAKRVPMGIQLDWALPSDAQGNYHLEKSADGFFFENYISIPEKSIQHIDNQPFHGRNYYRIRYQNLQGEIQFSSNAEAIWEDNQLQAKILFPQNYQLELQYDLPLPAPGKMEIIDLTGKICHQQNLSSHSNSQSVSLYNWSPGIYCIKIHQGGQQLIKPFRLW